MTSSQWFRMLGATLSFIGWIGAILNCALPKWKVAPTMCSNNVTLPTTWEGIWMSCVEQSTGQMQCKEYNCILDLTRDLQAARALTVISIFVGIAAMLLALAGWKYANWMEEEAAKATAGVTSGAVFIVAGIFCLIPVCWSAHSIIWNIYNPLVIGARRKELGEALYIGWMASTFMLLGGGLLCCNRSPKDKQSDSV